MATAQEAPVLLDREPGIRAKESEGLALVLADRFVALLGELSPAEWEAATACDPWTVKDMAAHLLGWAEALCSPRELASQTRAAVKRRKGFGSLLDAQNDVQVENARAMSPGELTERLRVMLPSAARFRRRLGGPLHYVPAYAGFLGGTFNLGYLMNVIFLRDLVVHMLDACRATGRTPSYGPAEVRVVTDMLKDWARRTGADATIGLEGIEPRRFVARTGSRAHIASDAGAFVLHLAGREPGTPEDITGDETAARRWIAAGCPV